MATTNPWSQLEQQPNKGILGNIGELFKNPLFLQYLSGAGGAVSSGQPVGAALGGITQQNISSQNFMKLLKRMLGGDIPIGASITHNETGTRINMPKTALTSGPDDVTDSSLSAAQIGQGPTFSGAENISASPRPNTAVTSNIGLLSPFVSSQPDISASDLAGVTPEMISQALQLKMEQVRLGQMSIKDAAEIMHLQQLGEYYKSQSAENISQSEVAKAREDRQMLEFLTKDERTELVKNFEYAQTTEGGGFVGSIAEFKNSSDSGEWNNYLKTKTQGNKQSFMDYQVGLRKAGATTIGGEVARTLAVGTAEQQLKTMAPDFYQTVQQDLMKDDRAWRSSAEVAQLMKERPGVTSSKARSDIQRDKVRRTMDGRIRQVFREAGKVTRDRKGWYLNGKLIVKDPYATD